MPYELRVWTRLTSYATIRQRPPAHGHDDVIGHVVVAVGRGGVVEGRPRGHQGRDVVGVGQPLVLRGPPGRQLGGGRLGGVGGAWGCDVIGHQGVLGGAEGRPTTSMQETPPGGTAEGRRSDNAAVRQGYKAGLN